MPSQRIVSPPGEPLVDSQRVCFHVPFACPFPLGMLHFVWDLLASLSCISSLKTFEHSPFLPSQSTTAIHKGLQHFLPALLTWRKRSQHEIHAQFKGVLIMTHKEALY